MLPNIPKNPEKPVKTLLIPPITNFDLEMLDKYWRWRGGDVVQVENPQVNNEALVNKPIAIYGPPAFGTALSALYNVTLVTPDPMLITRLDGFVHRTFKQSSIGAVTRTDFPAFIRSLTPGIFKARIYHTIQDFKEAVAHIRRKEEILLSPVVAPITKKIRGFVLNGKVLDCGLNDGVTNGLDKQTIDHLATRYRKILPPAVVIDVAHLGVYNSPVVLGIHPAWCASFRGCGASKVFECIAAATISQGEAF